MHAMRCAHQSMTLLQCCAKCVADGVAIHYADMMSNDVISTRKRQLSSNKSLNQKYLLVYCYKTKLSSDVSTTLADNE